MLADSNCTSWGEDLIMWVTGEPLCCVLEINMFINYTSIFQKLHTHTYIYTYIIKMLAKIKKKVLKKLIYNTVNLRP